MACWRTAVLHKTVQLRYQHSAVWAKVIIRVLSEITCWGSSMLNSATGYRVHALSLVQIYALEEMFVDCVTPGRQYWEGHEKAIFLQVCWHEEGLRYCKSRLSNQRCPISCFRVGTMNLKHKKNMHRHWKKYHGVLGYMWRARLHVKQDLEFWKLQLLPKLRTTMSYVLKAKNT